MSQKIAASKAATVNNAKIHAAKEPGMVGCGRVGAMALRAQFV
jgi:hypothetical protein